MLNNPRKVKDFRTFYQEPKEEENQHICMMILHSKEVESQ